MKLDGEQWQSYNSAALSIAISPGLRAPGFTIAYKVQHLLRKLWSTVWFESPPGNPSPVPRNAGVGALISAMSPISIRHPQVPAGFEIDDASKALLRAESRMTAALWMVDSWLSNEPNVEGRRVRVRDLREPESGDFRHLSVIVEVPDLEFEKAEQLNRELDVQLRKEFGELALVVDIGTA